MRFELNFNFELNSKSNLNGDSQSMAYATGFFLVFFWFFSGFSAAEPGERKLFFFVETSWPVNENPDSLIN